MGWGALDYKLCQPGDSRLSFRGPCQEPQDRYSVILGGTEIFGRFMETTIADTFAALSETQVVNLGCLSAGIEAFENDPVIADLVAGASLTVLHVTGVQLLSNAYYQVHPRRNDRFIQPTPRMREAFPRLDFTEVHFVGHLLRSAAEHSPEAFREMREELQAEWLRRMSAFLDGVPGDVVLLWMAAHEPPADVRTSPGWDEPLFVTRKMLDALAVDGVHLLEVVATPEETQAGRDRMIFPPHEEPAAQRLLGPIVHQRAAISLLEFGDRLGESRPAQAAGRATRQG